MATRVLWLLFASWAVFLSMFAFASEYKIQSNDVKGYGATDERIDNNNNIDWMGMSREDFIGKYPRAPESDTVRDKEDLLTLLVSSDANEIDDLAYDRSVSSDANEIDDLAYDRSVSSDANEIDDISSDRSEPYIGMCAQLCDALPEALDNGMISGEKRANYRYHLKFWREDLYKYAKELMDKVGGFKLGQELRYRILLSIEARVLFQLCLKGRGDATDHEIEMIRIRLGSAKNLINEGKDRIRGYKRDLKRKRTNSWICLIASLVGMLLFVVSMCKFRRVV
eukprot:934755_1